jgi:hypothetical protein
MPTSAEIASIVQVCFNCRDGLIGGQRVFYGTAGFMRQLGLLRESA